MHYQQNGFGHYSAIVLVVIVAIIGLIGLRVFETGSTPKYAIEEFKTVVALGDISCDKSKTPAVDECGGLGTYNETVALNPDAVLALGDIQYEKGSLDAYQSSFDPTWKSLKNIFYPSPGNHEYATASATGYYEYFKDAPVDISKGYYSFVLGDWKIISLNSNCDKTGDCSVNSTQLNWLRAELAQNSKKCTLAFWHHPRFTSGRYLNNVDSSGRSEFIWDELLAAKSDVVLNGHDHLYERFAPQNNTAGSDPNGVREFIVGSGGRSHYSKTGLSANSQKIIDDTYGVLAMKLYPSSYSWEFHGTDDKVLDSGSSNCP